MAVLPARAIIHSGFFLRAGTGVLQIKPVVDTTKTKACRVVVLFLILIVHFGRRVVWYSVRFYVNDLWAAVNRSRI